MSSCCEKKACEIEKLMGSQLWVLKTVLVINAMMFVVECTAGLMANSTALVADSLDMLGDASVYAFSIYVVGRSMIWKARAAYFKGYIMAGFGVFVLTRAIYQGFVGTVPAAETMGAIGFLALASNLVCLGLLFKHRGDDVNMRSTWTCSRNDIIANTSVIGAAGFVNYFGSNIPDVIVGSAIAALFISSAIGVFRDAKTTMRSSLAEA